MVTLFLASMVVILFAAIILPAVFQLKGVVVAHLVISGVAHVFLAPTGDEFAHQVSTAEIGYPVGILCINALFAPVTTLIYILTKE